MKKILIFVITISIASILYVKASKSCYDVERNGDDIEENTCTHTGDGCDGYCYKAVLKDKNETCMEGYTYKNCERASSVQGEAEDYSTECTKTPIMRNCFYEGVEPEVIPATYSRVNATGTCPSTT